eukprot:snap_masked-scaffold_8-processed-gene-6.19-mRNA-1 protein AED:1.00 eAED:1.00 QI:0/-1/0/0/-1/1/1/0/381
MTDSLVQEVLAGLDPAVPIVGGLSFGTGMGMALHPDETKKFFQDVVLGILNKGVLNSKKVVSQNTFSNVTNNAASLAFKACYFALYLSYMIHALYLSTYLLQLNHFENATVLKQTYLVLVTYYSHRTLSTAFDAYLDDDKSAWQLGKKRLHILLPFNLMGKEKLGYSFNELQAAHQLTLSAINPEDYAVGAGIAAVMLFFYSQFFPGYVLASFSTVWVWNSLYKFLKNVQNTATVQMFSNFYDPIVQDFFGIAKSGEGYENFGRQYLYLRKCNQPLQDYAKSLVFADAKKSYGLAGAKAATVLARGVLVAGGCYTIGMLTPVQTAWMYSYYLVHAGIMYDQHFRGDVFDNEFPRYVATAGEGIVSALLWTLPLLNAMTQED